MRWGVAQEQGRHWRLQPHLPGQSHQGTLFHPQHGVGITTGVCSGEINFICRPILKINSNKISKKRNFYIYRGIKKTWQKNCGQKE